MKSNNLVVALVVIAISMAYLAFEKHSDKTVAEAKQHQIEDEAAHNESVRKAEAKRIRESGKKLFGK